MLAASLNGINFTPLTEIDHGIVEYPSMIIEY